MSMQWKNKHYLHAKRTAKAIAKCNGHTLRSFTRKPGHPHIFETKCIDCDSRASVRVQPHGAAVYMGNLEMPCSVMVDANSASDPELRAAARMFDDLFAQL